MERNRTKYLIMNEVGNSESTCLLKVAMMKQMTSVALGFGDREASMMRTSIPS